jgi:geranylgeranyl transferase type-2 subunit beta
MSDAPIPFLLTLAEWLNSGMRHIADEIKNRHREFILGKQTATGGFVNRFGEDDLYYTSFAVRSLQILGAVPLEPLKKLEQYMLQFQPLELSTIDLLNWIQMALALQLLTGSEIDFLAGEEIRQQILYKLESCRTADGGYGKSVQGSLGSTYHTFLTLLVYELLGADIPQRSKIASFIRSQQRDDGGFVEIAPVKLSGTNPTAAAVVALHQLSSLNTHDQSDIGGFLQDVWNAEGGYAANSRIPFPDALSTFTAMITAKILQLNMGEKLKKIEQLLNTQLQFPQGGFRAAMWDEQADLEYTFYGIGCLAIIKYQASVAT